MPSRVYCILAAFTRSPIFLVVLFISLYASMHLVPLLQVLNPCECPAFVFCWLELISHKCFMPKMLRHLRGWPHYHRLLICLLRFMYPFLNQVKLSAGVQALYKGMPSNIDNYSYHLLFQASYAFFSFFFMIFRSSFVNTMSIFVKIFQPIQYR